MSYDVSLTVDHKDGHVTTVFDENITWNVRPMLVAAGLPDSLRGLDDQTAADVSEVLSAAMEKLRLNDGGEISALEPSIKWGTYKQLLPWMEHLHEAVLANPGAVITVS